MSDTKGDKAKKKAPVKMKTKDTYALGGLRATGAGKKANPLSGFKKDKKKKGPK